MGQDLIVKIRLDANGVVSGVEKVGDSLKKLDKTKGNKGVKETEDSLKKLNKTVTTISDSVERYTGKIRDMSYWALGLGGAKILYDELISSTIQYQASQESIRTALTATLCSYVDSANRQIG